MIDREGGVMWGTDLQRRCKGGVACWKLAMSKTDLCNERVERVGYVVQRLHREDGLCCAKIASRRWFMCYDVRRVKHKKVG